MSQPCVRFSDIGNALAQALLDQVETATEQVNDDDLDTPRWSGQVAGTGIPTADACDGMVWTRVVTMFPTDGSGQPLQSVRWDSEIPAWAVQIELGELWCHPVIEEGGGSPDQSEWAAAAQRDGQWRMIIMQAARTVREDVTDPLASAVMAQQISAWSPIGPDGGFSGGLVVLTFVVNALALC